MKVKSRTLFQLCLELWQRLGKLRQRQFLLLFVLMIIASFAEIVSIGLILPFLGLLADPEKVFAHEYAQPFIQILNIKSSTEMLLPVVIAFCSAAILSGGIRLLLMYANIRYSHAVGADLSLEVYRRTLYQPYQTHVSRNSSEVIAGITGKIAMLIGKVLVPLLTLFSSSLLFFSIIIALIAIDPTIAIIATLIFGLSYAIILKITKQQLKTNGERVATETTAVIKSLQEGLGGIRDVLLDGTQEIYCRIYQKADRSLRHANGQASIISASPRYLIETLGMILIAVLAYSMSQRAGGMASTLPILGAVALGAQRLLPVLQQGYAALTIMRSAQASLQDVIDLLDQPLPKHLDQPTTKPMKFENDIKIQGVGFKYNEEAPEVLKAINLSIVKGQCVGFIGATGGGKSTLLDILMGLLPPTEGQMLVDGVPITLDNQRSWQLNISHVPQHIYLSDSSIKENIAFGISKEKINQERLIDAVKKAQLEDVINDLPEKLETTVGERGVRLSGGQRQRIGIARALYRNSNVLILDEATSALDVTTEQAITQSIEQLNDDLTILIIAHRKETLKNCDVIYELKNSQIHRQVTYADLIEN
mgnify:CR=1 FL=1